VRLSAVPDLIADPWSEPEPPAVAKLGLDLAGEAEKNMTLFAPVVCAVPRGVFDRRAAAVSLEAASQP